MFETDDIKLWNLTPGINSYAGPQEIFNLVGNIKHSESVREVKYSINNKPEKPVYFKSADNGSARLVKHGDFNIDTIKTSELDTNNEINFRLFYKDGSEKSCRLDFLSNINDKELPSYKLDLNGVKYAQEVGQVVDGKWYVNRDEYKNSCLEILKEDAGHDRIILFGNYDWTSGYELYARLCVTSWTHVTHNVGLLFKWNPHMQGDGTSLPVQWSTGLGYYYSLSKGLRIRFGKDVHYDSNGKKQGDYVLKEKPLSYSRYIKGKLKKLSGIVWKNGKNPFSQIIPGKQYCFKMNVHPDRYSLTVWEHGSEQPSPQIVVDEPPEILSRGSVGIIAYNCGVRLYEFNVDPM